MNRLSVHRSIEQLRCHGIVPSSLPPSQLAAAWQTYDDGFDLFLLDAWQRACECCSTSEQRRARRIIACLQRRLEGASCWTWGIPGASFARVQESVGPRLVWWPRGVPEGRWVSIVSSRLQHPLELQLDWFATLRQVCQNLNSDNTLLLATRKSTTGPFVERCGELFHVPLLRFELPNRRAVVWRWFEKRLTSSIPDDADSSRHTWSAWVSPRLDRDSVGDRPLQDRVLVSAADQVIVLEMRAGGNIEHLIGEQLDEKSTAKGRVLLAVGAKLIPVSRCDTIPRVGRSTRRAPSDVTNTVPVDVTTGDVAPGGTCRNGTPPSPTPLAVDWQKYLTHFTRRVTGPWPDQSDEDYRDALILGRSDTDHSALATLARIVDSRRLCASTRAIRGGWKVVCFTAVAPPQFESLRAYRSHRRRWDFEPYGISILRSWLQQRGTRPVRYGDQRLWSELPETEQPFFQQVQTRGRNPIDWSAEQEWRHIGDVDLSNVPADTAVLFVPTVTEAKWLRQWSPWPVVVLNKRPLLPDTSG